MGIKLDGRPISAMSITELEKGSPIKKKKVKIDRELKKRKEKR